MTYQQIKILLTDSKHLDNKCIVHLGNHTKYYCSVYDFMKYHEYNTVQDHVFSVNVLTSLFGQPDVVEIFCDIDD